MIKIEEALHLFGSTNPTVTPVTDSSVAKKIVSDSLSQSLFSAGFFWRFFFAGNSEQNFSSPVFHSALNAGLPSVYIYMIYILKLIIDNALQDGGRSRRGKKTARTR